MPIAILLCMCLVSDGCVSVMGRKSAKSEAVREKEIEATTFTRSMLYDENYTAVEYNTDKYKKAPTMRIKYYNDNSAEVHFEIGGQAGIYGEYPYGVLGEVILYTGSGNLKTTFANADISIMDGRATIDFRYPMGENEIIVFEKTTICY